MKKIAWILIAVAMIAAVAVPGVALANSGPHGGYVADTDLCAQCHRAHTAPSTLTWTDSAHNQKNALLISESDTMLAFCLACHDDASQGADTNVIGGTYQGTKYGTPDGNLISGAFGGVNKSVSTTALVDQAGHVVTSFHITTEGSTWGAFGGGTTGDVTQLLGTGNKIVMTCTTCHDPHGSSNYRILRDVVNGVTVGGYDSAATGKDPFGNDWSPQNPKPTPFVISDEEGFPQGGFQLHVSYATTYTPNYTKAQYAKAPDNNTGKGMSGWCAGCHTQYIVADAASATLVNGVPTVLNGSKYNSGDGLGFIDRHRHSVNVALASYTGTSTMITGDTLGLPLDHDISEKANVHNSDTDWIECLTCHNAHGTTATMAGYANFKTLTTDDPGYRGVLPDYSNLLKLDNRAVCEHCHNK